MRRYALLGERLGHSYSVPIHQAIFRVLGLEADYRLLEIPRGELGARFPALCRELDGMNVTIPYKEEVMPLLDGVDDFARQVGAVNTVLCREGASRGYNTDVAGFMAMLERYGIPVAGHPAYVLGTGGASQAARTALKALGAASVTLVSRKPEPGELGYGELAERFSGVLVNCTPVGMYPHGEATPSAQPAWTKRKRMWTNRQKRIYIQAYRRFWMQRSLSRPLPESTRLTRLWPRRSPKSPTRI